MIRLFERASVVTLSGTSGALSGVMPPRVNCARGMLMPLVAVAAIWVSVAAAPPAPLLARLPIADGAAAPGPRAAASAAAAVGTIVDPVGVAGAATPCEIAWPTSDEMSVAKAFFK